MHTRQLRSHQRRLARLVEAIATGQTEARDIFAAVTPGGGRSLLPALAATRLIVAVLVERICWVVVRNSLQLQAEQRSPRLTPRPSARPAVRGM